MLEHHIWLLEMWANVLERFLDSIQMCRIQNELQTNQQNYNTNKNTFVALKSGNPTSLNSREFIET